MLLETRLPILLPYDFLVFRHDEKKLASKSILGSGILGAGALRPCRSAPVESGEGVSIG